MVIKSLHEANWLERVMLSLFFQPYCANANHIKQPDAVLCFCLSSSIGQVRHFLELKTTPPTYLQPDSVFFTFYVGNYLFGSTKRATIFMQNLFDIIILWAGFIIQNLVFFIKLASKLCSSWFTLLFYLLFACYTTNFGLISMVQPHSPNLNHCP